MELSELLKSCENKQKDKLIKLDKIKEEKKSAYAKDKEHARFLYSFEDKLTNDLKDLSNYRLSLYEDRNNGNTGFYTNNIYPCESMIKVKEIKGHYGGQGVFDIDNNGKAYNLLLLGHKLKIQLISYDCKKVRILFTRSNCYTFNEAESRLGLEEGKVWTNKMNDIPVLEFTSYKKFLKYFREFVVDNLDIEHLKELDKKTNKANLLNEANEEFNTKFSDIVLENDIDSYRLKYIDDNLINFIRLDIVDKYTSVTYETLKLLQDVNLKDLVKIVRSMKQYDNIIKEIAKNVCLEKIGKVYKDNLFIGLSLT